MIHAAWRLARNSRRSPRRALIAGTLAVALVVSAVACSKNSQDEATGDSLKIALSDFGNERMDPVMEGRSATLQNLLPMYDTILEIGEGAKIVPGLATDWQVAPDNVTWTFHLRKGVQFHDGWGELTADDVKFSLERWANEDGANAEFEVLNQAVDHVEVVDPYTFKIITRGPRSDLPLLLSPHQSAAGIVFSKKYLTEKGGNDFEAQSKVMEEKPIGSGPYKFVSHSRGNSIVYEAVDNHWRVTPSVKRIEYLLVPERATQEAMLMSGEADIVGVSGDMLTRVQDAGYEIRKIPGSLSVGFVVPGTYRDAAKGRPAADVRVRQAMSLALDRKAIMDATVGSDNAQLPTTPYGTTEVTEDLDLKRLSEDATQDQKYDPDEAKRLLAEAGYPNGVDIGPLDAFERPGVVELPKLAEIVAGEWAKVGIKTTIRAQDYDNYRPHFVDPDINDPYNAAIPATFSGAPRFDAATTASTWFSYDARACQLLKDATLDKEITELTSIIDPAERMQKATDVFQKAHEQFVIIPLFLADSTYGVNAKTVGKWQTYEGFPFFGRILETIGSEKSS
jgi:peptide/nickel transport system substrate-binding protein